MLGQNLGQLELADLTNLEKELEHGLSKVQARKVTLLYSTYSNEDNTFSFQKKSKSHDCINPNVSAISQIFNILYSAFCGVNENDSDKMSVADF